MKPKPTRIKLIQSFNKSHVILVRATFQEALADFWPFESKNNEKSTAKTLNFTDGVKEEELNMRCVLRPDTPINKGKFLKFNWMVDFCTEFIRLKIVF